MKTESDLEEKLFDLFIKNEALGQFEDQIRQLITACKDSGEISLLLHSLNEMTILNHKQLSFGLKIMGDHINSQAKLYGKIAVVAMAYDSSSDGSQLILYMLKTEIERDLDILLFNTVPSYLRKMRDYPNFVLIDDFSGTGATVLNRLEHIKKDADNRGIAINASVCLIAAMEKAKKKIENNGYIIRVFKELKAGISDHFSGAELVTAKLQMLRLETELNPEIKTKLLPSFGSGGAEALYFLHPGNAPNSNFPIFWWPEDKDGRPRRTLMKRLEL